MKENFEKIKGTNKKDPNYKKNLERFGNLSVENIEKEVESDLEEENKKEQERKSSEFEEAEKLAREIAVYSDEQMNGLSKKKLELLNQLPSDKYEKALEEGHKDELKREEVREKMREFGYFEKFDEELTHPSWGYDYPDEFIRLPEIRERAKKFVLEIYRSARFGEAKKHAINEAYQKMRGFKLYEDQEFIELPEVKTIIDKWPRAYAELYH